MHNSLVGPSEGFWLIGVVIAFALTAPLLTAAEPDRPAFQPRRVVRAFPAIVMPDVISADRVTDQVRDEELVLGVTVNNVARAYPINMLTRPTREIINDKLGDRAIAATW